MWCLIDDARNYISQLVKQKLKNKLQKLNMFQAAVDQPKV